MNDWYIEDGEIDVTYDWYDMVIGTNIRIKTKRTNIFPCMVVDDKLCITLRNYLYPTEIISKIYVVISKDSKTVIRTIYPDQKWYDVINAIYWLTEQAKEWCPAPENGYN